MNKRYIYMLCLMLSAALCLTSCLKDDDDNSSILYDDMAVSTFQLTSVNRTIHTTSSTGADSTYQVTLTSNSLPVFTIDQEKLQIYNTEPLPVGCDLTHILALIYTFNNGTPVLKGMSDDELTLYSSSDSIDFSQPRELRIYAADGSGYRTYQVTVNASATMLDGLEWEQVEPGSDGIPQSLFRTTILKAGTDNTFMLSQDGGNIWSEETIGDDEDASLLPTGEVGWVSFPYSPSTLTDYELIAGTCHGDTCTVWRKITDRTSGADDAKWVNIPLAQSNQNYLPQMEHLNLVWFNEGLYAIGSNGIIYQSQDQGITWKTVTSIALPEGLQSSHFRAVTDEAGNLWLLDVENNQLWKGKFSYKEYAVN